MGGDLEFLSFMATLEFSQTLECKRREDIKGILENILLWSHEEASGAGAAKKRKIADDDDAWTDLELDRYDGERLALIKEILHVSNKTLGSVKKYFTYLVNGDPSSITAYLRRAFQVAAVEICGEAGKNYDLELSHSRGCNEFAEFNMNGDGAIETGATCLLLRLLYRPATQQQKKTEKSFAEDMNVPWGVAAMKVDTEMGAEERGTVREHFELLTRRLRLEPTCKEADWRLVTVAQAGR
ncbi:hypothetical protein RI054_13g64050 [Pseudoscourfieldia marina]